MHINGEVLEIGSLSEIPQNGKEELRGGAVDCIIFTRAVTYLPRGEGSVLAEITGEVVVHGGVNS